MNPFQVNITLWSNFLPSMGDRNTITKGNLCPAFRKKGRGQRANYLQVKTPFCHNGIFWGDKPFTMISSGFAKKLGRLAVLVRIGWSEEDRCRGGLAKELWQGQWQAMEVFSSWRLHGLVFRQDSLAIVWGLGEGTVPQYNTWYLAALRLWPELLII